MGNARIIPANTEAIFLPYQARWIADRSRLKLIEKSRQIGLSWSTAYAQVSRIALVSARLDEWVSSRDEIQARLFLEDCKLWAGIADIAARDMGEMVIDDEKKHSALVLQFANGRRIHSMSSNPDAQAGKRGSRVLDEFALHPDPRKLWSIAYPGITWGGQMEVISTHRGSKNFFNTLVREAKEGGNPKKLSLHTVTLENALDDGFLWKLQQSLPAEDERQEMDEAAYFDWVKSGAADEESFQQEYMCKPADDDAAFLEYDLIASAEYAQGADWQTPEGGTLYAGVDIGRTQDLTVLWVVELLGDVLYTRHVETLKKMRKSEQEKVLWPWFARCARVCIDQTGLGIGWVDDAQDRFGEYAVEGVSFTAQSKEALAYPVRSRMEERRIRIPYTGEIRADLRQVTKQVTAAGNIRFTAERTPDGHADRFWALALAIHAADGVKAQPWRPLTPAPPAGEARTLDDDWIPQDA
ncbi:terminase large subunit domain-containing protein [Stappia sp. TSB10P1A]|uniref:phage terminase large subunit family protein n=1 Tax=Stappia sp. TSB10P1A TaxID=2003585 RepID=UPI001643A703|nr:terminase family protein [Stappia sp. TSB10P1A]